MNMTLNSFNLAPAAAPAADAVPVAAAVPSEAAQPGAVALQEFAQWLGLGQQAAALPVPGADAAADAEGSAEDAPASTDAAAADQSTIIQQDSAQLAAMAMPLTLPAALPAFVASTVAQASDSGTPTAGDDAVAATDAAAMPLSAAELRTGLRGAALPAPASAQSEANRAPVAGEAGGMKQAAAASLPEADAPASLAPSAQPRAHATPAAAAQSASAAADTGARAAAADAVAIQDDAAAVGADRPAAGAVWGATGAAPAAARVAADSVVLAGPPAAWRQTLHEALGERLNLQLTKNAEQAVIRLDPPMLGRVEIAIRHSGGSLEVSLTATHSEVLRQLHSVSDNLRSDLAQRQFTDVAVTVTAAPRNTGPALSGEQQGRGRQPGREDQPQDPGRALAEAGDPASTFSLNGRA